MVSRPRVNGRVPGRRANGSGLQELRKLHITLVGMQYYCR